MIRIAVLINVMGYGCNLSQAYKWYLDMVITRYKELRAAGHIVKILCHGGATNQKSAPDATEAKVIAQYLFEHGVRNSDIEGWDQSIRADVHLENIRKVVAELGYSLKVEIFCDSSRAQKMLYLGNKIFSFEWQMYNYALTMRNRDWRYQNTFALAGDLLANRFPKLFGRLKRIYKKIHISRY